MRRKDGVCGEKNHPSAPSERHQHLGGAHKARARKTGSRKGGAPLAPAWARREPNSLPSGPHAGPGISEIRGRTGIPTSRTKDPEGSRTTHEPWFPSRTCVLRPASKGRQGRQSVPGLDAFRAFHIHFQTDGPGGQPSLLSPAGAQVRGPQRAPAQGRP